MLNEYKTNFTHIVIKAIEIYDAHNLILKKLGYKLMIVGQTDLKNTWDIRIKQRLHIEMKKELRQVLTTKSIWNHQKIHREFNLIDTREQPYIDELDKVPPVNQIAINIISNLEKVKKQLHLPLYLKDLMDAHHYQLKSIYTTPKGGMRIV